MPFPAPFLPTTLAEADSRGWKELDIIILTGDAHVDHPSFPAALLGRWLEVNGFRVGVIAQPDPQNSTEVSRLGLPRLFFAVTAGALDSMVANYTALKRRRSDDPYAPGGKAGGRPDRALTVYCNLLRRVFGKKVFIVAGGLEASLRRFAHYDFWSDSVRRSILMDCGADILVHGMGEGPILEIASRLAALGPHGDNQKKLAAVNDIRGVTYRQPKSASPPEDGIELPAAEEVAADNETHARAFQLRQLHRERRQWQINGGMRVVANPPWPPLSSPEMDAIYAMPFTRESHPSYGKQAVPALEQVRFSITSHRGCFSGCAFCAISAHQGKAISSRSRESILAEARAIAAHPGFRGTINDLGGPTANMYRLGCTRETPCNRPSCLWPERCRDLCIDQTNYLNLLREVRTIPRVKHVFVTTGIRTDLAVLSKSFVRELAEHHTSGLLKVAPEHISPSVLKVMRKPTSESFLQFLELHRHFSELADRKQYVLPYIMAAHPGCTMEDMIEVHHFLKKHRLKVEQCQIFTPTPGTAATVMYATGLDPANLEPVFVERDPKNKEMQKALILHHLPENAELIKKAFAQGQRKNVD